MCERCGIFTFFEAEIGRTLLKVLTLTYTALHENQAILLLKHNKLFSCHNFRNPYPFKLN